MIQHFNQAMDYIEEHLTEEISIRELAQVVGTSEYHFKRTFSFIAGQSLNEYIKLRRLATANVELVQGYSVTDVAVKYGYQTIEGFSRAFKNWSGYLPSEVKENKIQKSFPKFSFYMDIKGGNSMEYKIEKKEAFKIVGVKKVVSLQYEGVNNEIEELVRSITDKQYEEMEELGNLYPHQGINASYDFDKERLDENVRGSLTHMIGYATTKENTSDDLEELEVPALTWAIFPNKGMFPKTLQDTWARIYSEWLGSVNYELVDAPEISFSNFDDGENEVYSEIWIAVKEKSV